MIRGLNESDIKIKIIGPNKKPETKEFEFQKNIDPQLPIVYHTYRHGNYSLNDIQYNIVRTMLEVSRIPQNWVHRFNQMDEIWIPNMFNYQTFLRSGVFKDKMFIIPSPVDFSFFTDRTVFKLKTKKKFIFLSLFNYENRDRKGLDILLKAYTETFTKSVDVCLVLKTKTTLEDLRREYNLSEFIPEIEIINEVLDYKSLLSLYRAVSCFVLPSRGEGIGRPYLDAMMTGLPIIATAWSGNSDFLNNWNSYPVKYKLVDVDKKYYLKYPGFFGAKWAEPDLTDLKHKMQFVVKNHRQAQNKAQNSKNEVLKFKTSNILNVLIDRLKNPLPRKMKKISSSRLFERLMPLYYPDLRSTGDIFLNNRYDFKRDIDSLLIVGSGFRIKKAYNYIYHQSGIRKIYLHDEKQEHFYFMNFQLLNKTDIEDIKEKVDIVVLAVHIKILEETYNSIIKDFSSIPIYIFD